LNVVRRLEMDLIQNLPQISLHEASASIRAVVLFLSISIVCEQCDCGYISVHLLCLFFFLCTRPTCVLAVDHLNVVRCLEMDLTQNLPQISFHEASASISAEVLFLSISIVCEQCDDNWFTSSPLPTDALLPLECTFDQILALVCVALCGASASLLKSYLVLLAGNCVLFDRACGLCLALSSVDRACGLYLALSFSDHACGHDFAFALIDFSVPASRSKCLLVEIRCAFQPFKLTSLIAPN